MSSTNSFFDRNSSSRGWNQDTITRQVALVLGVGGIGNALCMSLCRLGFKKIIIFDNDKVEESNLNRQILFNKDDVGKYKTTCAKANLESQHSLVTEIEIHTVCALERWDLVIDAASKSTCVFNTIDHGDYFDFAVASLARSFKIPMVDGGTDPVYGTLFSATISKVEDMETCWGCFNDLSNKNICYKLRPKAIQYLKNICFVPPDPRDGSNGSNVYTATSCSQFMVALMIEYIMPRSTQMVPDRIICPLLSFDLDKFHCIKSESCLICTQL